MDIPIDRDSPTPLHLQIARHLRALILGGTIPADRRLPPTRSMAERLGVNRSTVTRAYERLWEEGLVEGQVGRGTVIKLPAGEREAVVIQPPWSLLLGGSATAVRDEVRELASIFNRRDVISLAAGLPPPELYPLEELRNVAAAVLRDEGRDLLHWSPVEGYPPLRELVARRLGVGDSRQVLITSGSTQGLDLLTRSMVEPGATVIVESPTYLGALQLFRAAGARVIAVPMTARGIDLDVLEEVLARTQPRLIYVGSSFQNPTGVESSLEHRRALLRLAYRHRVPLVEDDAYSPLRYDGAPVPSLLQLDRQGYVIHVGTVSKILVPGLRVGYLAAPLPVVEHLQASKYMTDLFTSTLTQAVVHKFWAGGGLQRHLEVTSAEYRLRRDAMVAALGRHCPDLELAVPAGGFFIWARLPRPVGARPLLRAALDLRVSFMVGDVFHADGMGQDHIRLTFPSQPPEQIDEAAQRLGAAIAQLRHRVPAAAPPPPMEPIV